MKQRGSQLKLVLLLGMCGTPLILFLVSIRVNFAANQRGTIIACAVCIFYVPNSTKCELLPLQAGTTRGGDDSQLDLWGKFVHIHELSTTVVFDLCVREAASNDFLTDGL